MIKRRHRSYLAVLFLVFGLSLASGCATTGQTQSTKPDVVSNADPIEPMNRKFFKFNETLDKYFMKPIAKGYVKVTPQLFRSGVTNFFNNLAYLNVVLNSFLQGKIEDGFMDSFRFLFNSTIGIGGLVDVSTTLGFKQHDEDLGQTLAVWGVQQGAYLYIPLYGPNTVRKVPDYASSYVTNPFTYVSGGLLLPVSILNAINKRANLLEATNIRDEAAVDKYIFTREAWLQQRRYLIYDGNPPVEGLDDIFNNDTGDESEPGPETGQSPK
jgi:phospholipid-binding lipoprotein MlaA